MASRRQEGKEPQPSRRRPATNPEAQENQLISLAMDVAERQMRDGTASAQVISHFLKLGSTRERLEQSRLEHEVEVLRSKAGAMEAAARMEKLYTKALDAMRGYKGESAPPEEYDYDD